MRSLWLTAPVATALLAALACSSNSTSDSNDATAGASAGSSGAASSSAGTNAVTTSGGAAGAAAGGVSGAGFNGGSSSGGAMNGGGAGAAGLSSAGSGGSAGANVAGAAAGGSAGSGGAAAMAGMGGVAGGGGASVVFPPNCTCLSLGPPACTPTGHVSYTLAKAASPTPEQVSAYAAITCAMDGAVAYYNCNTNITKQLNVTYDPGVPTADGNINGSVRFGGRDYMECVTGMHEIAHAVGVGTAPKWSTYSAGGVFTGTNAIAQLRAITGNASDVLHSDTQHFWPYGLNYTSEAHSTADLVDHCQMVTAIRKDLGL